MCCSACTFKNCIFINSELFMSLEGGRDRKRAKTYAYTEHHFICRQQELCHIIAALLPWYFFYDLVQLDLVIQLSLFYTRSVLTWNMFFTNIKCFCNIQRWSVSLLNVREEGYQEGSGKPWLNNKFHKLKNSPNLNLRAWNPLNICLYPILSQSWRQNTCAVPSFIAADFFPLQRHVHVCMSTSSALS